MSSPRPDIFSYHDYQSFLKDWFAYKKANQSHFSLRWLAKKAGLATGYLPMVLSNKRTLSAPVLSKIMPHLGLNASEQAFLENLLKLRSTDSNEAHVAAVDRMQRFQQYQKLNPRETEVYEYLTRWYYVAIREMAAVAGFRADAEWIQERLNYSVSLKEVSVALEFLLAHGYLKKNPDGTVNPPEKAIDCVGDIYKVALAKFHREMFELAGQSIEQVESDERSILGHTCSLSAENMAKAKKIAAEAVRKIRALGEAEQQGESVYHLEVALFPLTKIPNKSKGSLP